MKRKMKIKSGTDDSKVWHDEKAQIEIATEKMSERPYARCMYFFSIFHNYIHHSSKGALNEVSHFATLLRLLLSEPTAAIPNKAPNKLKYCILTLYYVGI